MPSPMRSCWFSLRRLIVAGLAAGGPPAVVGAAAGNVRPATTALKIKLLLCIFIWSPWLPESTARLFLGPLASNTGHGECCAGLAAIISTQRFAHGYQSRCTNSVWDQ